jgi:predicted DNA-binding protein
LSKCPEYTEREKITKSELIKEALEKYLNDCEHKSQPFILGEELFGKYGSGTGNLSVTYKKKALFKKIVAFWRNHLSGP